jgi:hypothetical protein
MRNRMPKFLPALGAGLALFGAQSARAADPTTADCMQAAESSIQLRAQHKLRAARAQLLVCVAASCPADVRAECLRRVDKVNAGIPTVVFEAKDAPGNDLTDVKVWMDGELLVNRLEGTALSFDPGEHRFVFEGPGGTRVEKVLVLHEAEKQRRERIVLGALAEPGPARPAAAPLAGVQEPSTAGPSLSAPSANGQRTLGLVVLGGGAAAIAVGAVFGGMASAKWSSSKDACATPLTCPNHPQAVRDHDAAVFEATISTIAFAAGGAALAAGSVLFLTAPRRRAIGMAWQLIPWVGLSGAGFAWKGAL